MARIPQDPQIRMTEILDTTEQLFLIRGYHKTTISDIAKKMGVAQGMFYYYFKSKEEILEALINRHVASVLSMIKTMPSFTRITPPQKIELVISSLVCSVRYKDSVLLNALFDEKNVHIKDKVTRQIQLSISTCLSTIIEDGMRTQHFQVFDPKIALDFILKFVDLLVEAMYAQMSEEQLSPRLKMAGTFIENVLGAQAGTINLKLQAKA
ncbi:hypothetical protein AXX12_14005 [Anaerosporomusa subterranea]|uniref:HTH tetR-type domain-containing protein n=1 Tax=Anaerosporomusa subterranea TaxID=1794912 RepID=A0A154BMS1_ANASB|nr:TetR/AcrR family transcriptional regulator [Anaerosporomusa subterranea]KYZ75269.1 hypothetical protein AXX12_14005 [Anaerosporomusa subterranea]